MESNMRRRSPILPLTLLIAGTAVCAGIGYPLSKPTYSSTGMIHVKTVVTPILFSSTTSSAPYEGLVGTQMILLKSQQVIDSAISRPEWHDQGGDSSPAAAHYFRNHLEITRDGEMIKVTFHDADPQVAQAGVKAIIGSYTDNYLNNDSENSRHQLEQLEQLQRTYSQRLKTEMDNIDVITGGVGAEAIQAHYAYKLQEQNAAEAAWRKARHELDEWKTINAATSTQPAVSTPDVAKAKELEFHEEAAKDDYDQLNAQVMKLGRQLGEVQDQKLDMEETQSLLNSTKQKIEQISVEASSSGRISVISNGDRPEPHATPWWAILPAIYAFCFLLTWNAWPQKRTPEKPAV